MTLRIGMVGLGGIAQKAWLPVLSAATDWTLAGRFPRTRPKPGRSVTAIACHILVR